MEILAAIKDGAQSLDDAWLSRLLRRHSRGMEGATLSKPRLLARYLAVREDEPELWQSWEVDSAAEVRLLALLQLKPRRTASGVATISVLTKPWPCSSNCLYCPSDIRMPKSYLASEPACQRAERNFFDPYLQVKARLQVLESMGHTTDKVELIVLGGTWSDYPEAYQRWFVCELLRALSDGERYEGGPEVLGQGSDPCSKDVAERTAFYEACGLASRPEELARDAAPDQQLIDGGCLTYNEAIRRRLNGDAWQQASSIQQASWEEVEQAQRDNETAAHRMVGLVVETRPDLIDPETARMLRRLGCTKVQMGIQSLSDDVLAFNERQVDSAQIARAFACLRAFGFKTHVHAMLNLPSSNPEADKDDYLRLVRDPQYLPDEVKLYPCALVGSSRLTETYERGDWQPYAEDDLVDVLVADVLATPAWTRISRMIRDIPSTDIIAGNRRTNLRQLAEARLEDRRGEVREIRMREVSTSDIDPTALRMDEVRYATATSEEVFLQWVTEENHIAGFCRLSLPDTAATRNALQVDALPLAPTTAVIRELHVYGRVAALGESQQGAAQHAGLGRALVERACELARTAGYDSLAVISAVGTRPYYRTLGFADADLYQVRALGESNLPSL